MSIAVRATDEAAPAPRLTTVILTCDGTGLFHQTLERRSVTWWPDFHHLAVKLGWLFKTDGTILCPECRP